MNLMVGESHVHYAFDTSLQTDGPGQTKRILDPHRGWTAFSYHNGLTMFSVPNRLEGDLQHLSINIKISDFAGKDIVFVFGTNDAILKRIGGQAIEEYTPRYIDYIEDVRDRYGLRKAYVTTPWYVQPTKTWPEPELYQNVADRDELIIRVNAAIIKEAERHSNVHVISLIDIFNEEGEKFNDKYSFDGIHFNKLGRQKFFDALADAMEK